MKEQLRPSTSGWSDLILGYTNNNAHVPSCLRVNSTNSVHKDHILFPCQARYIILSVISFQTAEPSVDQPLAPTLGGPGCGNKVPKAP